MVAFAAGAAALVAGGALKGIVAIAASLGLLTLALRRAFTEPSAATGRAARRERKVLIVNPRSGGGKAARFELVQEASRRGIEPVVLGPSDDLRSLAEDAARRADVIGMAGGDGSQALVAGVASDHDVAFVCVPAGTRNHFALDLGIDRDDVVAALDAFDAASSVERRIDLAEVNGRTFVNNVSLGVYAEIVKDDRYRDAKIATAARLLPDLLDASRPVAAVTFAGPGGEVHEGSRLLLVSNNPYVLGRPFGFGGRPSLSTGRLGILAIDVADAAQAAQLVSLQSVGAVNRFDGWNEWTAAELTVHAEAPVAAGIDGEPAVLVAPLVFSTAPLALRVRLSADADRRRVRRSKEHAGAGEVLESLWALAAG